MRTLTNIGLTGGFVDGEDGWGDDMNANLLMLSTLVQGGIISTIAAVPGAPAQGDVYILSADPNKNKVAVYDNGAWSYFTPVEGWWIFNRATDKFLFYTGTAWSAFTTLPAGGTANQVLAKVDGTDFNVTWVNPPTGGGGSGGTQDENVGWRDPAPVQARRYWRFRAPAPNGEGASTYCDVAGFDFVDASLVSIASQNWGTFESKRVALQAATNQDVILGAMPVVITTDLGGPQVIGGIMLRLRADSFFAQGPTTFFIEGSADNANWTTYLAVKKVIIAQGTTKIFFRIRPYIVRMTFQGPDAHTTVAELEFAAAAAGADLTAPATTDVTKGRIVGIGNAYSAFDNNTTTYAGELGSGDVVIEHRFDTRPTLAEFRVQCRTGYPDQAPTGFQLAASRNGIDFTDFYTSPTGLVFTSGEKKSFALPTLAAGTDGSTGVVPGGGNTGQLLAKGSGTNYDTVWVDPPSSGTQISAKYWRLRMMRTLGDDFGVAEIQFLAGSTQLATGGVAIGSSSYDATYLPAKAFNGNTSGGTNSWFAADNKLMGEWIGYNFAAAVTPTSFKVMPDPAFLESAGRTLALDYSSDGVVWKQHSMYELAAGVAATYQTFTISVA